jgi:hypothetical protein
MTSYGKGWPSQAGSAAGSSANYSNNFIVGPTNGGGSVVLGNIFNGNDHGFILWSFSDC